jgi:hypothetical protein
MPNVSLSSTASIGLSATAFAPAAIRALNSSGRVGLTIASFRPFAIRALSTLSQVYEGYPYYTYVYVPASIGLTVSPVATQVDRCLQTIGQYVSTPTPISLGINGPSQIPILRTLPVFVSFGVNSLPVNMSLVRALDTDASIGLSGPKLLNVNRTMTLGGSIGLTGTAPCGRLATLRSLGSIGLTGTAGSTSYVRSLRSLASIGLTGPTAVNVKRTLHTLASLGLTGRVSLIVIPSVTGPNVIVLFEATDAQNPETYAAILPRDYHKIILDRTVDSYPQPFTLLN